MLAINLAALKKFAFECTDLTSQKIYEKFEFGTDDDTRDMIYHLGKLAYPGTPEPFRAAMNCLGENYNIQSLKDY